MTIKNINNIFGEVERQNRNAVDAVERLRETILQFVKHYRDVRIIVSSQGAGGLVETVGRIKEVERVNDGYNWFLLEIEDVFKGTTVKIPVSVITGIRLLSLAP